MAPGPKRLVPPDDLSLKCIVFSDTSRFYNRAQPHSAIGYRHPADLMSEFQDRMGAMFEKEDYLAA